MKKSQRDNTSQSNRRGFLRGTLLGAASLGAVCSLEEQILLAAMPDGAAPQPKPKTDLQPAAMPCGLIGKVRVSRLFLGGNMIGGWAHSRDLVYVSKLLKAYNTGQKIFETIELAEQCGINTVLIDPRDFDPILKYNRERNRKFQSLVCTLPGIEPKQLGGHVKQLVDQGATLVYVHGMVADQCVMTGRLEDLGRAIQAIQAQGLPAGVGGQSLETPMACEKHGLGADFYVKTFHSDRYWSATPPVQREEWCWYKPLSADHDRYNDNMFCLDAGKVAAFMEEVNKPWIAFKTMAAGAILPQSAFPFAFSHGADFIVAGMFDFQIEEDARIAIKAVAEAGNRERLWHG
jgi:hypothetical protein